jgi:hypothetical protein
MYDVESGILRQELHFLESERNEFGTNWYFDSDHIKVIVHCMMCIMGNYYKDCILLNRRQVNFSTVKYSDSENVDVIVCCP